MIDDDKKVEPVVETTCYKLGQVIFVPSYGQKGVFVGPGLEKYPEVHPRGYKFRPKNTYTYSQLISVGAVSCKEFLWVRPT